LQRDENNYHSKRWGLRKTIHNRKRSHKKNHRKRNVAFHNSCCDEDNQLLWQCYLQKLNLLPNCQMWPFPFHEKFAFWLSQITMWRRKSESIMYRYYYKIIEQGRIRVLSMSTICRYKDVFSIKRENAKFYLQYFMNKRTSVRFHC